MFNFDRAFLQQYPTGRWGFAGRIPTALCDRVPASKSALFGGRAHEENGEWVEYKQKTWATREEAVNAIEATGTKWEG